MKKIFIAPIVALIVMSILALWSAVRIQIIPESAEVPGSILGVIALIALVIIAICIVAVTLVGELRLEKIPTEKIVKEEERVVEVPPIPAEEVAKPPEKVAVPEAKPAEEEMVVCGGCGALVPASSKVCPNCGAEFEE